MKSSESVSGVFPDFSGNFFGKVPAVLGTQLLHSTTIRDGKKHINEQISGVVPGLGGCQKIVDVF